MGKLTIRCVTLKAKISKTCDLQIGNKERHIFIETITAFFIVQKLSYEIKKNEISS